MIPPQNVTGVTELLTAKHFDPIMAEGIHEHTWAVTTFYPAQPLRDGRALKGALRMLLDALPNAAGELPESMWAGEDLARHVAALLANCIGCRVTRPEGFECWIWL